MEVAATVHNYVVVYLSFVVVYIVWNVQRRIPTVDVAYLIFCIPSEDRIHVGFQCEGSLSALLRTVNK